ncbi:MAG TPA: protein kinase [Candidatus Obscuribacterales bacterium]
MTPKKTPRHSKPDEGAHNRESLENTVNVTPDCAEADKSKAERYAAKPTIVSEDLPVGAIVGEKYEIVSCLGRGGMSVVFKAWDRLLKRHVAIKVLSPKRRLDRKARDRFVQEGQAASQLDHPNLIKVYEFVMPDVGDPYLVMDYLKGCSLLDIVEGEGIKDVRRGLRIIHQVVSALKHAHKKNVIHRDLKPSNIMLVTGDDGEELVKIVDFGIAKIQHPDGQGRKLTETGEVFGSPLYMSPEQCRGEKLDARTDIYALGCVIYEVFTGFPPFVGENFLDTVHMHLNETAEPLSSHRPDLPNPQLFDRIIKKALAKDPNDRYQSVEELQKDLKQIGMPSEESSDTYTQVLPAPRAVERASATEEKKDNKRVLIVICLGLVALLGAKAAWDLYSGKGNKLSSSGSQSNIDEDVAFLVQQWNLKDAHAQRQFDNGDYERAQREYAEALEAARAVPLDKNPLPLTTTTEGLVDLNWVLVNLEEDQTARNWLAESQKDLAKLAPSPPPSELDSFLNTGKNASSGKEGEKTLDGAAPGEGTTTAPAATTGNGTTTAPAATTGNGTTTAPAATTGEGTTTAPAATTGNGTTTAPAATTGEGTTTAPAATTGSDIRASGSDTNKPFSERSLKESFMVAMRANNLGLGKAADPKDVFDKTGAAARKLAANKFVGTSKIFIAQARYYLSTGNPRRANDILSAATKLYSAPGSETLTYDLASCLAASAEIAFDNGDARKGIELLSRASDLLAKSPQSDSAEAKIVSAKSLIWRGEITKAISILKETLNKLESNMPRDYENLASVLSLLGEANSKTISDRKQFVLGKGTPKTPEAARVQVTELHDLEEQRDVAAAHLKRAIAIRSRAFSFDKMAVFDDYLRLRDIYTIFKQYDKLEPVLTKAASLAEDMKQPMGSREAMVLHDLGYTKAQRGDSAAAEGLYRRALRILDSDPSSSRLVLKETLKDLSALLQKNGQQEEAQKLSKRADGVRL